MNNNLGLSKFISNNDIDNIDISLTEINTSKIDNENKFNNKLSSKNEINSIISENMIKSKIDEIKENLKEKNKEESNNNEKNKDEKNKINEQEDKLMIGDISNMSDLSDNKGDLTLGMIFGNNDKKFDEINNENNNKNIQNEKEIKNKNDILEFNDFDEKDVDLFLGGIEQNKNLDISAIPTIIGDNEFNTLNDISMISSIKKINPIKNNISSQQNNDINNINNNNQNLKLNDLTSNSNQNGFNNNINNNDNKSFITLKSNETLGIDLTQLMEENGMKTDTKISVPQSQDLPILQEINYQHDNMRANITKRYNGLKIVSEWWKKSDIPSTLNALRILKDYSVIKDFFYYAIVTRNDITKIPLTLDSAIILLPYVYIFMKSKIDTYWKTACRAGMAFLKIFMEKIEITIKSKKNNIGIGDKILEEKIKKCEETVKIFRQIYESTFLRKRLKEGNKEDNNLAYAFFTDLQFFLKSYDDNNKIIISNI